MKMIYDVSVFTKSSSSRYFGKLYCSRGKQPHNINYLAVHKEKRTTPFFFSFLNKFVLALIAVSNATDS